MREQFAHRPARVTVAERADLWSLGHETLGPAFTAFTRLLMERAAALGVDGLFFVARDGHLLERLFDALAVRSSLPLPRHRRYLCLSRLTTALPAVWRLGIRELRLGLNNADPLPLRQLLRAFSLEDDEVLAACARAGIALDRPVARPILSQRDVRRLLDCAPLQALVAERAARARARLRAYLDGEGLFGCAHAALVDVGWNGTIQNALGRAFAREPGWPRLRGFYLGLESDAWQKEDPHTGGPKEGLLADFRRARSLAGRAPFYFHEIFEQASRAQHGTTVGYREVEGRVVPIFHERGGDRDAERAGAGALAELQASILARATDEANGRAPALSRDQVLERIERFVFEPTPSEVRALSSLSHTDDWGSGAHRPLYAARSSRLLLRPRELVRRYHRAYWRPGLLHAAGGPLLARLYHTVERWRAR